MKNHWLATKNMQMSPDDKHTTFLGGPIHVDLQFFYQHEFKQNQRSEVHFEFGNTSFFQPLADERPLFISGTIHTPNSKIKFIDKSYGQFEWKDRSVKSIKYSKHCNRFEVTWASEMPESYYIVCDYELEI